MRSRVRARWSYMLGAGCLCFGVAGVPHAAEPQATASTAVQLTRLQSETVLLQAQLKMLQAKQQVMEHSASVSRLGGRPLFEQPVVTAVEGVGARSIATLRIGSGAEFEVQPGDTLPDGARVVEIMPHAVLIANRGRTYRLSAIQTTSADADAALPRGSGSTIPIPTLPNDGL